MLKKDPKASTLYFQKAALTGSPVAANNYGLALLRGFGCEKNEKNAASQFKLAADHGICLIEGIGVKQNKQAAAFNLKKSTDMGNVTAQYLYARLCFDGVGFEKRFNRRCQIF